MNRMTFHLLGLTLLWGCSSPALDFSISRNHPAHPDASQAPYLGQPDPLGTEARSFAVSTIEPPETTGPALPNVAAGHLSRILEAYFVIGDGLASDTFEAAEAHAAVIDTAMAALAGASLPDDPHYFHRRNTEVRTIRQQARAIGQAKELNVARVAYGKLSDALERLLQEIGVPGGFDKPVYSFTCGMFEAAPRDGVWLQIGDDVRNPYYGSKMLACYRTEYELPTVKGAQAKSGPHDQHGGYDDKTHDYQQGGLR